MPDKYLDENSTKRVLKYVQKNQVNLGAFDTIDTSNADYNLISRLSGIVDMGDLDYVGGNQYTWGRLYIATIPSILITTNHGSYSDLKCSRYGIERVNDANPNNEAYLNKVYQIENGQTIGICLANNLTNEQVKAIVKGAILQYKLDTAYQYTEKVIKGVPILNLDQNGANWVRSEWEKGLNLYSGNQNIVVSANNQEWASTRVDVILKPNTKYTIKFDNAITGSAVCYLSIYDGNNDIAQISDTNSHTFTTTNATTYYFYFHASKATATGTSTYSNIMLNEGDHAYPYQPYNGAIVHEKEIENVAYKNVNNNFSTTQTVNANGQGQTLIVNSSDNNNSGIQYSCNGNVGGYIGVSNKKPYWWNSDSSGKAEGELLTTNDIAELKSLVYDNQYPAVKTIKFNTFQALPNSIDGNSLIFGAGSDMTKIDGMSVVVNQLVNYSSAPSTRSNSGIDIDKETNGRFHVHGTATVNGLIDLIADIYSIENGKTYVALANCSKSQRIYFTSGSSIEYDNGNGVNFISNLTTASADVMLDCVLGQTYDFYITPIVSCLTQFFGSNDNIPSDLLSNPSLFTSKYWKGSLDYDTGHIESAKPKAIVSRGANLLDYANRQQDYGISSSNGEIVANSGSYVPPMIKVAPNTTYSYNFNSSIGGYYLFFYDINKNYVGYRQINTSGTFGTPIDAHYIRLQVDNSSTTPMLNIGSTALPYTDYIAPKRYPISVGTDNSVNGVNTIKDIMGVLNTDRKIGVVDLGTLNYSYESDDLTFYAELPSNAISPITKGGQGLCDKYNIEQVDYQQFIAKDKILSYCNSNISGAKRVFIKDTTYNDTTAFKTAMNGVYLYYELATPTTEQNPQDANFPTNIEIQKGGSLEIESDLPCDITLEVAVSKVY